jgi:hypothetical protein
MSKVLSWDSPIEEAQLLPAGIAEFVVVEYKGAADKNHRECGKFGDVPVADLTLRCTIGDEEGEVRESLMLVQDMAWKVSKFFTCIGDRKPGSGPIVPDWRESHIVGQKGRCVLEVVAPRTAGGRSFNRVAAFLAPGEAAPAETTSKGGYQL